MIELFPELDVHFDLTIKYSFPK